MNGRITIRRSDLLKYPEERRAREEGVRAIRESRRRQAEAVHDLLTGETSRRLRGMNEELAKLLKGKAK